MIKLNKIFLNIKTLKIIFIIFIIIFFQYDNKYDKNNDLENKKYKFYKKRRWCPKKNAYHYINEINSDEESLINYFKIWYNDKIYSKIIKEESYKDIDTPHGNWFYYNNNKKLIEEKIYKKGQIKEQIINTYHKTGEKIEETHYVFKNNKKQLRIKTKWIYDKKSNDQKKIRRIEYYNTGILDEFIEFEYNLKSMLSKRQIFHFDRRLKSYNIYTYNHLNNLIKDEIFDKNHKLKAYINFNYSKNNQLKKRYIYRIKFKKAILEKEIEYNYDVKGNKIQEIEKALLKKRFIKIKEKKYFFDENNCINCQKIIDSKNKLLYNSGNCKK